MDMIITNVFALLQNLIKVSPEEAIHSRVCVSYILRYGLGEHLDESGQETMIKILASTFPKNMDNEQVLLALMRELR